MQVAVELSLQARTLQERYPGALARAPRQKDAHTHTKHRQRPLWMDDGALADANKAEAAPTSKLKLAS